MAGDQGTELTLVCPHHGERPSPDWTPYRIEGQLSIVFRFPCCDYTVQVNGLPVPGVHVPLPADQNKP